MKHIRRVYIRNFLAAAIILLVCFALLGAFFVTLSRQYIMSEQRDSMQKDAGQAVRIVSALRPMWGLNTLEMHMTLSSISAAAGYPMLICDADGVVVNCSEERAGCSHIGREIEPWLLEKRADGADIGRPTELDGLFSDRRYVIAQRIQDAETYDTVGYIIVSSDAAAMTELWRAFLVIFIVVGAVAMGVAFILSYITEKRQTKPINEMAEAANRFAKGDFSVRVRDTGRNDEIGDLTSAFNMMADSLERSEKMRREFIANVSHELKTPMTTITGFTDGILDGTIPPDLQEHYLQTISSETKRLSRLVRSMLDVSRLQDVDTAALLGQTFDVVEVARLTLLGLEKKISDKGMSVDAQLPEEPMKVRGSEDSITRVVYNLLDNAVKFGDVGSALKLEVWKTGGKAYVAVEDSGQTISPEELPLIFDRFHKTDRSRSMDRDGVGLGLYIVKSILDQHGEDIFVTSENGTTRFVFTLTLAQD